MSLTIEQVREQVARVEHRVDGIEFRWNVTAAWESDRGWAVEPSEIGFFIQVEYDEPDVDDPSGPLEVQQGRKWFVSTEVSLSEVVQTMLKAALASAEHRTREWFLVDGVRAYGPHQPVERLIAATQGQKEIEELDAAAMKEEYVTVDKVMEVLRDADQTRRAGGTRVLVHLDDFERALRDG